MYENFSDDDGEDVEISGFEIHRSSFGRAIF